MNTIAASARRISRPALAGVLVLVAAFAALIAVRSGLLDRASTPPAVAPATPKANATPRAKPRPAPSRLVLLPGLPAPVAASLRYSRVVVVSLYTASSPSDRAAVSQARAGARAAGAGFAALNTLDDTRAVELAGFVGPVSTPMLLVVRRPGNVVTRIAGSVESVVVTQAARNAGARRR